MWILNIKILYKIKKMRIYNASILMTFHQIRFINECARKTEFFVRRRRNYVLNNNILHA